MFENLVTTIVASPWAVVALLALCTLDGFLPPVPSESVLIALATLSVTGAGPPVLLLVLAGALGAFAGDQIAYRLGSRVPMERWPWFRGPRGRRRVEQVRATLRQRGTALIIAGRYVPVGRVAITMTAGATGHPRGRFLAATALAAPAWAGYCVLLGVVAGSVLPVPPLVAAVAGVLGGVLVGLLADRAARWVQERRAARRAPEAVHAPR
ncbi:membrane protein DedA, SNARE-associated domain [Pseudonocardia ammonioxydans]|uniref:Membrane protein DedA, SNARE-associated domain n=1 Tax=Pseudonocardia ammonioxydans TaxID=260086 RepID=A0A1I5GBV5_PSUAM|nr:VTT domain-containing protein [Pseudonocardia ammonioxydans]SFO33430.1 membrane protein DedA, SNARE-associated domain [Pseudonocardia ammonioxydans]